MEVVWFIIGFVITNLAWIWAFREQLDRQEDERVATDRRNRDERRELMRERNSLLDRIQRPGAPTPPFIDPNPEPAPEPNEPDVGLIGVVVPDTPESLEPDSE